MRIFAFFGLIISLLFSAAGSGLAAPSSPLPVVVSIAPQKYMLERVAGEHVSVTVLVKPGADPHSYEPTPAQMRECAAARIYFTLGLPFEDAWLPRLEGSAKQILIVSTIRDVQRVSRNVHEEEHEEKPGHAGEAPGDAHTHDHNAEEHHDEHDHASAPDPHVWLSPVLVEKMLPVIVEALSAAMPDKAEIFQANAAAFRDEIQAAHADLLALVAPIPQEKRVFLTFHPSWGYLAHDIDATELSIEVEGKEPGPKAMKAVIDAAREHALNTIFVEPQFPTAAAEAVAENIKAKVVRIDPLAENLLENWRLVGKELAQSFPKPRKL